MIALPTDHRLQILLVPLVVEPAVVIGCFAAPPTVKRFDHHDHAQAVGQIEQLWSGRIVRGAERVAAHFLEDFQLPFQGAEIQGRTERTEIVVVAGSLQRHAAAIELEAIAGSKLDRAKSKRLIVHIDGFSVRRYGDSRKVTVGLFEIPKARSRHGGGDFHSGRSAGSDFLLGSGSGGDFLASGSFGRHREDFGLR